MSWPPGWDWWASVVACQGRDWQAGFGDPPGQELVGQCMAHQVGAGGQCVDASGQRLVASVLMHQDRAGGRVGAAPNI